MPRSKTPIIVAVGTVCVMSMVASAAVWFMARSGSQDDDVADLKDPRFYASLPMTPPTMPDRQSQVLINESFDTFSNCWEMNRYLRVFLPSLLRSSAELNAKVDKMGGMVVAAAREYYVKERGKLEQKLNAEYAAVLLARNTKCKDLRIRKRDGTEVQLGRYQSVL